MPDNQEPAVTATFDDVMLVTDPTVPAGTVFLLPAATPAPARPAGLDPVAFLAESIGYWRPDPSPAGGRILPPSYHGDLIPISLGGGYVVPAAGRPYAARATTPTDQVTVDRPPPAGGVDDITAAIDGLCACPCRRPISSTGPSAYFADPDCQRAWHSARATDPGDVYQRADAAAYPHVDAAVVPLNPPSRVGDRGDARARGRALHDQVVSFRRHCPRCGARAVPITHAAIRVVLAGTARPASGWRRGRWQSCPACSGEFPGPAYTATVRGEGLALRLRLADDTFWVSCLVDRGELDMMGPVRGRQLVDEAWDHLIEQVAARHRVGPGEPGHDPVAVMDALLSRRPPAVVIRNVGR